MEALLVTLPYPSKLSTNRLWRLSNGKIHLNPLVKQYRQRAAWLLVGKPRFGNKMVKIEIEAFPPDKRRRDVDNMLKIVLDTLQHANVFDDDSQVCSLIVNKKQPVKDGLLEVRISAMA